MDAELVGASGRIYHLLPYERWLATNFIARMGTVESPKALLLRSGLPAAALRASSIANALIVAPFSIALLIATALVAHHRPQNVTPFIVNIALYIVLAWPFLLLQFRRRFQSARETRAFRAVA